MVETDRMLCHAAQASRIDHFNSLLEAGVSEDCLGEGFCTQISTQIRLSFCFASAAAFNAAYSGREDARSERVRKEYDSMMSRLVQKMSKTTKGEHENVLLLRLSPSHKSGRLLQHAAREDLGLYVFYLPLSDISNDVKGRGMLWDR